MAGLKYNHKNRWELFQMKMTSFSLIMALYSLANGCLGLKSWELPAMSQLDTFLDSELDQRWTGYKKAFNKTYEHNMEDLIRYVLRYKYCRYSFHYYVILYLTQMSSFFVDFVLGRNCSKVKILKRHIVTTSVLFTFNFVE